MADFISGILGTACLCSIGIILSKLCSLRENMMVKDISPQYLLISKEHYDELIQKLEDYIINEQPRLPLYSEISPLHLHSQPVANNHQPMATLL